MASRLKPRTVALIALLAGLAFGLWRLALAEWDPAGLAEIGTLYSQGDPNGSQGYDGQFAYYIAIDPNPDEVASKLDVPAYRYQRILYPLLARGLALGMDELVPWALFLLNLAAHALGTWAVAKWLVSREASASLALVYGLWVGLISSVGLDLNEPLAFALIAGAWWARRTDRYLLGAVLLTLSFFAKETGLIFWAAALATDLLQKRWRQSVLWLALGVVVFLGWQAWLWVTFGRPGLGAGGAMATPFEWIPFMGLWRIGMVNLVALGLFGFIFGPTIVFPAVWGVIASTRDLFRKLWDAETWALFLNTAVIAFLPFSTFREPLGLVRLASGMVLAVIYYAAQRDHQRTQNYSYFWIALLALLIRS
ncbi:MAG: hypothetical protein PVI78_06015 [Anaerolineales bacterium]|jgi:hypothetical protein